MDILRSGIIIVACPGICSRIYPHIQAKVDPLEYGNFIGGWNMGCLRRS